MKKLLIVFLFLCASGAYVEHKFMGKVDIANEKKNADVTTAYKINTKSKKEKTLKKKIEKSAKISLSIEAKKPVKNEMKNAEIKTAVVSVKPKTQTFTQKVKVQKVEKIPTFVPVPVSSTLCGPPTKENYYIKPKY